MPNTSRLRVCVLLFLLLVSSTSEHVFAADVAFTGFGTVGYARSDQDFQYLRYIDNDGTFKVDTLFGFQTEARFSSKWGATIQAVASAPRNRDSGYEATIRWAFLSFRPDNEWLFRVGRLRPPVLINTQNAEVGVTYDQARLPAEVYSLSPVYDVDGAAITKTWAFEHSELNVDAYWGKTDIKFRLPVPGDAAARSLPQVAAFVPPQFFPERVTFMGLVLSHAAGPLFLRGGLHRAILKPDQPIAENFVPTTVPAPPPFGGNLYLPSTLRDRINVDVITLGADVRVDNWRITAEYGQRIVNDTKLGVDSWSAYATVSRNIGKWTPYATYARLLSGKDTRKIYEDLNATPVPLAVQGPPLFLPASFHRILAGNIFVYDQHSTMLGASYSFSATSKLKFEWMRTHVGLASALVDGDVHNRYFNVFTLAYSFAF